ncbi:MAG TPA: peptidase M3 [Rhodobacteraceae bacterium]|nr:peptidase M3 [Paracoccaceae bacterium]
MTNPLLEDWTGDFALPPFGAFTDDHFAPAIDAALAEAREHVVAIADNPEPATFANTVEALELADETLGKVLGVFFNLAGADANPAREALQREVSPKLAAFSSDVSMNAGLFARIEALWQDRDALELDAEQARVLLLTRRRFVRAGALLEGDGRERLRAIMARLAALGTEFMQNLLADEREWAMNLSESDISCLPGFLQDAARAAGEDRGAPGSVITTSRSLITPFLAFSPDRALRKKAYEAYSARGAKGGETDNRAIAAETLKLRAERARLLGHADFASFKLEPEMAGEPEAVEALLKRVWAPARAAATRDAALLEARLHADGYDGPLEPWDWHYYSGARRRDEHDLDEAEVKPYLQIDRMIEAAFDTAHRLFGLDFRPLDITLYHPDARAWEVTREGRHMAVFIGDYFARGSKRSGAWCSTMRSQKTLGGDIRPVVVNVCNFVKPAPGTPALLGWDDARTLFHEFGHALHNILSDVTYGSISGTSVARDFVELPSQLFEHWLEVAQVLDRFATHAETGAALPEDLRDKLLGAARYDMGFQTVEYLASALVDLAFHRGAPPADPMQRQAEVLEEIGLPRAIRMRHATPHFAHVFAGDGYSAGYYSYMWSEVMDADAFAAFEEAGDAFDPDLAARLETHVLSAGSRQDAAEAYTAFRGALPGVEALLAGRGLLDEV